MPERAASAASAQSAAIPQPDGTASMSAPESKASVQAGASAVSAGASSLPQENQEELSRAEALASPESLAACGSIACLVAEYHEALYRYAYRLSGSVPDAEDLTQQVFLVAQQKLQQVRDSQCVRGWLFTVLRNCYLKGRRKGLGLPVAQLDVGLLPATPPSEPIDSEELQTGIDSLSPEFKIVVMMFYFEHRSYREIAEALDIPPGTVMSRLARAKAHLRKCLAHTDAALPYKETSSPLEPERSQPEQSETTVDAKRACLVEPFEIPLAPSFHHPTATRR